MTRNSVHCVFKMAYRVRLVRLVIESKQLVVLLVTKGLVEPLPCHNIGTAPIVWERYHLVKV